MLRKCLNLAGKVLEKLIKIFNFRESEVVVFFTIYDGYDLFIRAGTGLVRVGTGFRT